jgi:hypothetical protein
MPRRKWPQGRVNWPWRKVEPEQRPTHPYVAPHTSKIHTLITLGIRHSTKSLVSKAWKVLPCGFDSHRPLHSKTMSDGSACRPDYRHESPGMTRFMNSSNMGTVNAVSP